MQLGDNGRYSPVDGPAEVLEKKAPGSSIKIYVTPGVKYKIGLIPYLKADNAFYQIHEIVYADDYVEVSSDSTSPVKAEFTLKADDFTIDDVYNNQAHTLKGIGSYDNPVKSYENMIDAIAAAPSGTELPVKIYVGNQGGASSDLDLEFENTVNIENKNILLAEAWLGNYTYFSISSDSPIFTVGKNGKLRTDSHMNFICDGKTAIKLTDNGYFNTDQSRFLSAGTGNPVFDINENGEIKCNSGIITVMSKDTYFSITATSSSVPVDSRMIEELEKADYDDKYSYISVNDNGKITFAHSSDGNSDNSKLYKVKVDVKDKASASFNETNFLCVKNDSAISSSPLGNLYLNDVEFISCTTGYENYANYYIAEDSLSKYKGIITIGLAKEDNWKNINEIPGLFEFNNIVTSDCTGEIIASGADIVLGGENNSYNSIHMNPDYPTGASPSYPRIYLKNNLIQQNKVAVLLPNHFTSLSYMQSKYLTNGVVSERYNRETKQLERVKVYPQFFCYADSSLSNYQIIQIGSESKLSDLFYLYTDAVVHGTSLKTNNTVEFDLIDTGVIGRVYKAYTSGNGKGFNFNQSSNNVNKESYTFIIKNSEENTYGNTMATADLSHTDMTYHFYATIASDYEPKVFSTEKVFPYFRLQDSVSAVFEGKNDRDIAITGEGTEENTDETFFEIKDNADLSLNYINFAANNCNAITLSGNKAKVSIGNCIFEAGDNSQFIKVTGNDCSVNFNCTDKVCGDIYVYGTGFTFGSSGMWLRSIETEVTVYIDSSVKESYGAGYKIYDNKCTGTNKWSFTPKIEGLPEDLKFDAKTGYIISAD